MFLFFVLFLHLLKIGQFEVSPIVKLSLGKISGHIKESFDGKQFSAFEGIPYAKPPIGEKRFEAPEPAEPWLGILETTFTTKCAQTDMMHHEAIEGEEDCLHINVYVPGIQPNPDLSLDVIVHIHGGAYMYLSGDSYTNPDFIVDQNIIFVTFNYRLGILGFLSTEDDVIPGNNGLKDQVMALEWIQKNIQYFGGNSKSITLTGLSAGGASVHLHYLSHKSRNLFQRGFSQSGVALNPFSLQEKALEKAKKLGRLVKCPIKEIQTMVKCLKQRPFKTILKQIKFFFGYLFLPFSPFAPVIENGKNPFLDAHPYLQLEKGDVLDVPWMISNTIHEGLYPAIFFRENLDTINKKWEKLAPILLDFNYTLAASSWKNAAKEIKNFYIGKHDDISKDSFDKVIKLFSDRMFLSGSELAVRVQSKVNQSPVYFYSFGFLGDYNEDKYVMHGADGKYLFGNVKEGNLPLTENEMKMKNIMVNMLVSFAKTGKPEIKDIDWKPTSYKAITFLNITGNTLDGIRVQTVDELTPRSFWKSMNILENDNLGKTKDEL